MSKEIIKKAFLIVENKIENFRPKQDACYLMYHTEHGDYQELDTDHTYCEDCIKKVISEKTEQIKDGEHWKPDDFFSINYEIETMPERDSMLICNECGTLIDSGVLWTYDQDLDYYLYSCDEKDYQEFSKENFYKLSIILMPNFGAFLKFPEKTLQIAEKAIKYLGGQNGAK